MLCFSISGFLLFVLHLGSEESHAFLMSTVQILRGKTVLMTGSMFLQTAWIIVLSQRTLGLSLYSIPSSPWLCGNTIVQLTVQSFSLNTSMLTDDRELEKPCT